jgi:hypothetical protein
MPSPALSRSTASGSERDVVAGSVSNYEVLSKEFLDKLEI